MFDPKGLSGPIFFVGFWGHRSLRGGRAHFPAKNGKKIKILYIWVQGTILTNNFAKYQKKNYLISLFDKFIW